MEEFCNWLAKSVNSIEDSLFEFADVKHTNVIYQATTYIREHYTKRVTLDSVAQEVSLSPSYFTKVFKKVTGISPTQYRKKNRKDYRSAWH